LRRFTLAAQFQLQMKILITGGAGFIGSHLAEAHIKRKDRVTVIDDLSTGSLDNLRALEKAPHFRFVLGSVSENALLADLVSDADFIYHLAAAVGVELVVHSPVRTIETNIHGTESVLAMANIRKIPVLITSTSEVYGKSEKPVFSEDDDLHLGPTTLGRWSYACSKALDEFLALAYWRERGLPVYIVRLFNTVGPRQTGRYGMVLPRFVGDAMRGKPIKVFGDGKQTRCFCHVSDVVRALMELPQHPRAVGNVFNVGSTEEISILEVAQRVVELTGSKSQIQLIPYDRAYAPGFEDMRRRVPNTEKIHKLIGWKPTVSFSKIIASIAEEEKRKLAKER
jgi:UDP-glucose 4-epimerase